jgi:hypothetical protein
VVITELAYGLICCCNQPISYYEGDGPLDMHRESTWCWLGQEINGHGVQAAAGPWASNARHSFPAAAGLFFVSNTK